MERPKRKGVPLKPCSAEFMIPMLVPLKIGENRGKGGRETKPDLAGSSWVWGPPGHKTFLYPPFLVCMKKASASSTFPGFKGQIQAVTNWGREWMQK